MLFIHSCKNDFSFQLFCTVNSSNIDNHSKASAFNKFKCLLCKYYPRFSKISRNCEHLSQYFLLLYDCVPSLSQFLSIDKLSKNDNVSELGMGKNPTTPVYSEMTKC